MKQKINLLWSKFMKVIGPYKKNIIFPLLKISAIIIVCAIIVRFVNGRETLAEYAAKNPDIAYSSHDISSNQ